MEPKFVKDSNIDVDICCEKSARASYSGILPKYEKKKRKECTLPVTKIKEGTNNLEKHQTDDQRKANYEGETSKGDLQEVVY